MVEPIGAREQIAQLDTALTASSPRALSRARELVDAVNQALAEIDARKLAALNGDVRARMFGDVVYVVRRLSVVRENALALMKVLDPAPGVTWDDFAD